METLSLQSSLQQGYGIIDLALSNIVVHFFQGATFSVAISTIFICLTITFLYYETRRRNLRVQSFDGPRGLPFIGNLFHLKRNIGIAAEQYRIWSREYGDVFQVQLGDIPVLVVNGASTARAIFFGNSGALSSRPTFYTFHGIISKSAGYTMGTAPYSKSLNLGRKKTPLGKPAVASYIPILDTETRDFIRQCLDTSNGTPIDPLPLLLRQSLSLDLSICWGRRVSLDDPLLREIPDVEHQIVNLRNTMTNLQDCIPLLRFPWSSTTKKAESLRERRSIYFTELNRELDERIQMGTQKPCLRADLLSRPDVTEEELNLICLSFISAGMSPTSSTLDWSIAFLAQRPDIQEAAYQAISTHYNSDVVLGEAEDDQGCEYVVALAKECLRYFTTPRASLPRSTVKEFSWEGKVIPVGTTVFLNAWGCNMDPNIWPEPFVFDPTRWLKNPNAPLFTYGIGYRSCSGISLANRLLYLFFVRLISAFEVLKGSDVDVNPVTGATTTEDLVCSPERYTVIFKPRDEARLRQALRKC
ncbi:cytochrome P450 [Glonium stellatum]|uniref:Cytochrome P450 n=1 Tax=Glonium stellatum TaxID=574774 RepID=A0A8E2EWW5_9PEZI|nr:cytochrome P450 [Glonium stellatum]